MPDIAQTGGTASVKLCGTCGQDCAGKPRAKDPKGNYMCMACVDRAKEAQSAQVVAKQAASNSRPPTPKADLETINLADGADNSFLLAIGESASAKVDENKKPCPNCFKKMPLRSVMCVNCGFNTKSGEQLHVRVLKPKEERTRAARGDGHSLYSRIFGGFSPVTFFLLVLALTAGPIAAGILAEVAPLYMIGAALTSVITTVVSILVIIDGFKTSFFSGILLCCFWIPFVGLYWFYYVPVKCENSELRASWLATMATFVIHIALIIMMRDEVAAMLNLKA